ncbi:MAG: hypothetical protein H0X62_04640 [Bacteroidetes bacterium]|nr:hypothetical protein [Bacteroidota bacterium]
MKLQFLRTILFLIALGFSFGLNAQTPEYKFKFVKEEILNDLDCYKEGICPKILIPDEYEAACVLALSHYPELQNEKIEFVYGKGSYSMAARPVPLSLFRNKKNRKYKIFINTESKSKGLLLPNVGFNAQVGIVGHELAHILYYTKKSSFRIVLDGIGYMSKSYRAKFEKETDRVAIERGLGWQLYEFSNSTQNHEDVPDAYKLYKTKIYMCPHSIKTYIEKQHRME